MNRRRWRTALAALVTAAALAAVPGTAAARDGRITSLPSTTAAFSLRGSNGYMIRLQTFRTGRISISAFKGDVDVQYMIHGRPTSRGLEANFGQLGHVSVRFQAGDVRPIDGPPPRGCEGHPPVMETGRFKGTIRFRGEQGYTSVSSSSAYGSLLRTFRMTCHVPGGQRPAPALLSADEAAPGDDAVDLVAAARTGGRAAFLEIDQLPLPGRRPPSYVAAAGTGERRGRVLIQRRAFAEVNPMALTVTPLGAEPGTLTLKAFGPFAGTGSYLAPAGTAPSWTGNLRVRLPGVGDVPLTGPAFRTAFCHDREGTAEFNDCEAEASRLLTPATNFPFLSD